MRKIVIWSIPIAAAIVLSLFVHVQASNSDAFIFARSKVLSSSIIKGKIGAIRSVALSPFSGVKLNYTEVGEEARLKLKVVGERGSVRINIEVSEDMGTWVVREATMDGVPLSVE